MAAADSPPPAPEDRRRAARRRLARQRRIAVIAGVAVLIAAVAIVAALLLRDGDGKPAPAAAPKPLDPLRYDPAREDEYAGRFAAGLAHVIYAKSPGGAVATARRVVTFRPAIEEAVRGTGIPADTLEAMVFLESAGRPDVLAGDDVASAAGLVQIVGETATAFLAMDVDIAASRTLTRRIARAQAAGDDARVDDLRARRRTVDARFDPPRALAGAVRYLTTAQERFGRLDLAVASYHMGIGNLEQVIRTFAGADEATPIATVVADGGITYARLALDASPLAHAQAWERLAALGDDSATYLWRVAASAEAMRLSRAGGDALAARAASETAKASSEEVHHPRASTTTYADPAALAAAWKAGELVRIEDDPAAGIVVDAGMGRLAAAVGAEPALYRGLRPPARDALRWLVAMTRAASGDETATLTVTSTVRDETYQARLRRSNVEATSGYSLHTTGYALDIARLYRTPAIGAAFQVALDRLAGSA